MHPTTLLDSLSSDFLEAFSALLPKSTPKRVLVYVESDDDIAFWRNILTPFEKNDVSFDIQLPVKNTLEKGKLAVLNLKSNVGKYLILCVDSDYDYLLQNTSSTSSLINGNDYIFQTYSYSIENLQCYASSLHMICTQSSKNDTKIIDFEELMRQYSTIIYKLFLWSVYFSLKQDNISFTITNFCDTIKILDNAIVAELFFSALQGLQARVDAKIQELEAKFPNDTPHVEALIQDLKPLGVNESNVYLFAKGHTVKDNVVIIFLRKVVDELSKRKYTEIGLITDSKIQTDHRNAYKKQIIPIELVLNSNTEYKTCFLYEKIHSDLIAYIQKF